MFSRVGSFAPTVIQNVQQQRGMATLKAIQIRLKSVKNIQKITQSMKMVSAAKYSRAERELRQVRPFGEGTKQFYEKVEVEPPKEAKKKLMIAMTSDRGLNIIHVYSKTLTSKLLRKTFQVFAEPYIRAFRNSSATKLRPTRTTP